MLIVSLLFYLFIYFYTILSCQIVHNIFAYSVSTSWCSTYSLLFSKTEISFKSRALLKLWERGITAGQRSVEGRMVQSESSVSAVEANSWKPLPVQEGSPP